MFSSRHSVLFISSITLWVMASGTSFAAPDSTSTAHDHSETRPSPSTSIRAIATSPGSFVSLAPARILNSLLNQGTTGPIAAKASVPIQALGQGQVPTTGVAAIAVSLTVTQSTGRGYLTAWADGKPQPTSFNLNFAAGQTITNMAIVPVGSDGAIRLLNASAGRTQVIADVTGYFLRDSATGWDSPNLMNAQTGGLTALSCANSSYCLSADGYGNAFRYNGEAWQRTAPAATVMNFVVLSCPSSSFCMGVDFSGYTAIYNGSS